MLSEEKKSDLAHEHYKDTFALLKTQEKRRDFYFYAVLVVVTVMLFQIYSPTDAGQAISDLLTKELGISCSIDVAFLSCVVWFALLLFVVKYHQILWNIETLYVHAHNLENYLNVFFEGSIFTREGKSYLSNYPLFSKFTCALYTKVFPGVVLLVGAAKIVVEFQTAGVTLFVLVNLAFLMFILATFGLFHWYLTKQ